MRSTILAWVCLALTAQAASPVALHPDNPHYLLFRAEPALLIGSTEHYGAVLNADFDYITYLDQLQADGLNLTRTFSGVYCEPPGAFNIEKNTLAPRPGRLICPWQRTGNKYDLTRWDEAYFRRLKDFVAQAGMRGVVVELVLFCPFYEDPMWALSPLKDSNNVNGVGAIPRTEVYTLKRPEMLAIQQAMVRRIVTELKGADNLYYEICNEPYAGGVAIEWQHAIADTIVDTEKTLGVSHLIAQNIANGTARVDRPHPAVSIFTFHYATPPDTVGLNYGLNKAIADDETGFKGQADFTYRREGWEFLLAGGAIFDHLDHSFTTEHPRGTFRYPPSQPGGGGPTLRRQLGILRQFMQVFDFVNMQPAGPRTLAKAGEAYAVYVASPQNAVSLTVPAGTYRVEWVNTKTGNVDKAEQVRHGGGPVELTPPAYQEDIALRVIRKPS